MPGGWAAGGGRGDAPVRNGEGGGWCVGCVWSAHGREPQSCSGKRNQNGVSVDVCKVHQLRANFPSSAPPWRGEMGTVRDPAAPRPPPARPPRCPAHPDKETHHVSPRLLSRGPPVARSISRSPSPRGGAPLRTDSSERGPGPPPPRTGPASARPPAAQRRDAPSWRGGGQVPRGAPRHPPPPPAAPRPRGSPTPPPTLSLSPVGLPAALPPERACPPAAGVRSALERIRSGRAAGFRNSSGLSAARGNVCASSSSCQPGASPGNFRPCAFRVPAGVTHPPGCRNLRDVKSEETRHISRGTGGPNNPVANQRRDWDVCNQR
ncbi:uncharacterized protein ACIB01_002002 [Guaruba guarouba]